MTKRVSPENETPEQRALRLINMDMDRTDPVSVQRYTRKGNLRQPTGYVHPNSLAALERHRDGTRFDGPNARRCKYCRRLAVRELSVCYWHGGKTFLRVMRRNNGKGAVGKTSEIAMRNTRRVFREQLVPVELFQVPIFVEVAQYALPKLFNAPSGRAQPADIGRRIAARLLVREMIAAWLAAQGEMGDPNVWTRVVVKARAMGFGSGS